MSIVETILHPVAKLAHRSAGELSQTKSDFKEREKLFWQSVILSRAMVDIGATVNVSHFSPTVSTLDAGGYCQCSPILTILRMRAAGK